MKAAKAEATSAATELLVSVDTKAVVKVGEFSRDGMTRVATKALDHDFNADARVTPVGILLPQHDDLRIFMATSARRPQPWVLPARTMPANKRLQQLTAGPARYTRKS